jgi:hypothetical protein
MTVEAKDSKTLTFLCLSSAINHQLRFRLFVWSLKMQRQGLEFVLFVVLKVQRHRLECVLFVVLKVQRHRFECALFVVLKVQRQTSRCVVCCSEGAETQT